MTRWAPPLVVAALALTSPVPVRAQQVAAALSADTVLVGDVFRAAIRVELPPGFRAVFPDSIEVTGDVENAGRRIDTAEELPDGGRRVTAVYPLSAWRPGPFELPAVPVRIEGPDGADVRRVEFRELIVRSVLPSDTAGVAPRPPKDVLGGTRVLWPFLLALLAAGVAGAGLVHVYRRRRPAPVPAEAELAPRERALAALDHARTLGLVEAGEFKTFYSLVTAAVRSYVEALDPAWGADLTSTELLDRTRERMGDAHRGELASLLERADLVKFARRRPSAAEAVAVWQAARGWVMAFDLPPTPDEQAAAEDAAEPEPREEVA
ncbi:MAG TPA: hypothetical protein VF188_15710 [Longimicrobiales bacterium]